jgi:isocitrate dehydrogenase
MMLRHMGLTDHANKIEGAVLSTIRDGKVSQVDVAKVLTDPNSS